MIRITIPLGLASSNVHRRLLLPLLDLPWSGESSRYGKAVYKFFYIQPIRLIIDDFILLYVSIEKFQSSINLIVMGTGVTSTNLEITELEK